MIRSGRSYSSYSALPVRRVEGAAMPCLRICPRLQAPSRFARWFNGQPPAQTEGNPIWTSFREGVLNGLNFWGRRSGSVDFRQFQKRSAEGLFFGRSVQWLEA